MAPKGRILHGALGFCIMQRLVLQKCGKLQPPCGTPLYSILSSLYSLSFSSKFSTKPYSTASASTPSEAPTDVHNTGASETKKSTHKPFKDRSKSPKEVVKVLDVHKVQSSEYYDNLSNVPFREPKPRETISKEEKEKLNKKEALIKRHGKDKGEFIVRYLARKEKGPWKPTNKLSALEMEKVRALSNIDKETYTIPFLASKFKVSYEDIRRILRSKFNPIERKDRKPGIAASSQDDPQIEEEQLKGVKFWDDPEEILDEHGKQAPRPVKAPPVTVGKLSRALKHKGKHDKQLNGTQTQDIKSSTNMDSNMEQISDEVDDGIDILAEPDTYTDEPEQFDTQDKHSGAQINVTASDNTPIPETVHSTPTTSISPSNPTKDLKNKPHSTKKERDPITGRKIVPKKKDHSRRYNTLQQQANTNNTRYNSNGNKTGNPPAWLNRGSKIMQQYNHHQHFQSDGKVKYKKERHLW